MLMILFSSVTAVVVVVVALADVLFDDDYTLVCVVVDIAVVASLAVVFAVVTVYDAGVPPVVHVYA